MSFRYELLYRWNITPWEKEDPAALNQLYGFLPPAVGADGRRCRALDLGCGFGTHAIALAQRGWEVVGIELIAKAANEAKKRATQSGLPLTIVQGDVTQLSDLVAGKFDLVLDIGTFHGLSKTQRTTLGSELVQVTTGDAAMIVAAFPPLGPSPWFLGASQKSLQTAHPSWTIDRTEKVKTTSLPVWISVFMPRFFRMRRHTATTSLQPI